MDMWADLPSFNTLTYNAPLVLADRTNGRANASVVSVCRLYSETYILWLNPPCVLPKKTLKKQIGNGLRGIEWSRDR